MLQATHLAPRLRRATAVAFVTATLLLGVAAMEPGPQARRIGSVVVRFNVHAGSPARCRFRLAACDGILGGPPATEYSATTGGRVRRAAANSRLPASLFVIPNECEESGGVRRLLAGPNPSRSFGMTVRNVRVSGGKEVGTTGANVRDEGEKPG